MLVIVIVHNSGFGIKERSECIGDIEYEYE